MQKRIVAVCFALILAFTLVLGAPATAQTYDEGQINASDVNLRSEATTGASALGKLAKGQKVIMVQATGDWWQITTSGYETEARTGYVLGKYITKTGNMVQVGETASAAANTAAAANTSTVANPSQQMDSLFSAAPTPVPTQAPSDGFLKNIFETSATNAVATQAPASSDATVQALINAGASTPAPGASVTQSDSGAIITDIVTITAKDVALRDKPSSKGKRITKLAKNTVLTLLSTEVVEKDWYKVSYQGKEAYVSKKYAKVGQQVYEKPDITFEWKRPADAMTASYSPEEMAIWNSTASLIAQYKAKNSDTIGWIRVPNLTGADEANTVNYPILIYSDNDYYLNRDFNKKKKTGGAIYMDYRNRDATQRKHVVVYGHNMQKSKSDFNYLHNYKSKSFFDSARVIKMDAYGASEWEVFSVHESLAEGKLIQTAFTTNKSWVAFCESLAAKSMYKTNVKFTANDEILSLITCDNNTKNDKYRVFVHARRVK